MQKRKYVPLSEKQRILADVLMKPGTVLFDTAHQSVVDGITEYDRKLLIVLNDGEGYPYITVSTTSKAGDVRGDQYGCQPQDPSPNFFLPLHSTHLKEQVWIQLDVFRDINPDQLNRRVKSGEMMKICELPRKILESLLVCAVSCKDISDNQKKELWQTFLRIPSYFSQSSSS